MAIYLLDHSLKVEICYEDSDSEYDDNICVSIVEECPEDEKLFRADEINMYLTEDQARELAQALLAAANRSSECSTPNKLDW